MKLLISIMIFCVGTAYSQPNCDKYTERYTPKDLDDALAYLTCTWSTNDKENFKAQPEEEAITNLHSGTGLSIRNEWGLWQGKNSLVKYFNSIGINHPDDMSSIILTSFHRQLNNKKIDLDSQVQKYKEYWSSVQAEKNEHNKVYKLVSIGDTVKVVFSKDKFSTNNSSLSFLYHSASLNDTTNCFVNGVVLKKQNKKGSRILTIQITKTSNCVESFLGDVPMLTGQKFTYNMTYFNLDRD